MRGSSGSLPRCLKLEGHGDVEKVMGHGVGGGASGQDAAEVDGVEGQLGPAVASREAAARRAGELELVRPTVALGPLLHDIGNQQTVVAGRQHR